MEDLCEFNPKLDHFLINSRTRLATPDQLPAIKYYRLDLCHLHHGCFNATHLCSAIDRSIFQACPSMRASKELINQLIKEKTQFLVKPNPHIVQACQVDRKHLWVRGRSQ